MCSTRQLSSLYNRNKEFVNCQLLKQLLSDVNNLILTPYFYLRNRNLGVKALKMKTMLQVYWPSFCDTCTCTIKCKRCIYIFKDY